MSLSSSVGLVSGINFEDIISQLTQVNARPIALLQRQQATYSSKQQALQSVNKALLDLNTALGAINSESDFQSRQTSISDEDVATVDSTDQAAVGSYSFKVLQLAQTQRVAAQGIETVDQTPIATEDGALTFQVGDGEVVSINVTSTTTLAQLRDAINSNTEAGVRASIINDGTATNAHRLVLTTTKTGAENELNILTNNTILNFESKSIEEASAGKSNQFDGTVTSSGTYTGTGTKNFVVRITEAGAVGAARFAVSTDGGLTFGPSNEFTTSAGAVTLSDGVQISFGAGTADFAVGDTFGIDAFDPDLQRPQDAVVEIDGIQIRRSDNTINDVIEGVTINAQKISESPVTITVNNDNKNSVGPIKQFVEAYNGLIKKLNEVAIFEPETQTKGPLFGDSTVRTLRSQLSSILSAALPGVEGKNSLGSIGINLQSDGSLVVDDAKLNEAIEDDFQAIQRMFAVIGRSTSSGVGFVSSTDATRAGTYAVDVTQAAEKGTLLSAQVVNAGGISANERLTFTQDGTTRLITINAGSTVDDAVEQLNEFFETNGFTLTASNEEGSLKIETNEYGSNRKFTVVSNQDGATANQLGIGTTAQSIRGLDVVGFIDGKLARGDGQLLTAAPGTDADGLKLLINSAGPVQGEVTFSRGIADLLGKTIEGITDSTDGIIKAKTDSIGKTIERIGERMQDMEKRLGREEDRLRKQFTGLELKLSTLQSQGNFLLSQLAAITPSSALPGLG